MKLPPVPFRGMMPIIGNSKLPPGYATNAVNTRLVSGDIQGYYDIGNPFQLAKPAPIWTLGQAANGDWLQFRQAELASFAFDIHAVPGTVASDTTGRRYITGYNALTYGSMGVFQGPSTETSVPQFTNTFYATDASQQGGSTAGAYPYKTFMLGVPNPTDIPGISVPSSTGIDYHYEFAAEATVNNELLNAAGTGYSAGDILTLTVAGWTLATDLPAATVQVQTVGSIGEILTFTQLTGGFYVTGGSPAVTTATSSGGTGSGATFKSVNVIGNQFSPFHPVNYTNGAGRTTAWSIAAEQWAVASSQGDLSVCYSTTAFGLQTSSTYIVQVDAKTVDNGGGEFADLVIWLTGATTGAINTNVFTGPAIVVSKTDGTIALYSSITGSNGGGVHGTIVDSASLTVGTAYYRITATMTQQSASSTQGYSATVTIAPVSTLITAATLTGFVPYVGEAVAVGINHRGDNNHGNDARFENIYLTVTQPATGLTEEFTNYLVTYVQQIPYDTLTQQSGPSDPSVTVAVTLNPNVNPPTRATVTVTMQPVPSGEFIAYENLFRLVADAAGNETYTLVTVLAAWNMTSVSGAFTAGSEVQGLTSGATATVLSYGGGVLEVYDVQGLFQQDEIILQSSNIYGTYSSVALDSVTLTYLDSAQDTAIGPDVLISQDWLPPPANMQGITPGPNGVMYGFFDNVLCCSAQGYPHAWPIGNQYSIDTPIRDVTVIDATVLIVDEANPYTAWGTDPSAMSMSKESSTQGCATTRGVVTHKRLGVVFPSSNGIAYYRGQGQLDLVRIGPTEQPPFSYEQWRSLTPTSMHAIMHDDKYYFWYDNGSVKSGYVLDLEPGGFGLHALDFHVTESYVDTIADALYLVPDFSVYAINGSVVSTALNIVSQWEYAATMRERVWERDEWLLPRPAAFARARVRYALAGSNDSVTLEVSSELGTSFNNVVTQQSMFIIGNEGAAIRWNYALTMTGEITLNSVELSETAADMLEGT